MVEHRIPCWEYCTIDTAVWDLLGRIQDRPVHELLTGKTERERIGCYFSAGCSLGNDLWLKTLRTCMEVVRFLSLVPAGVCGVSLKAVEQLEVLG
jgi:L-alanine-DL-glutamate epimerase-like enolase superfamily enzyme